jgi:hypothetical protein
LSETLFSGKAHILSNAGDFDLGMLVLAANAHYRAAGLYIRGAAWLFGNHMRFTHLGYRCRVAFLSGTPYLLTLSKPTATKRP